MIVSKEINGLARQLMEIDEKSRCSTGHGAWGKMADGDGEAGLVGQMLHLPLP